MRMKGNCSDLTPAAIAATPLPLGEGILVACAHHSTDTSYSFYPVLYNAFDVDCRVHQ